MTADSEKPPADLSLIDFLVVLLEQRRVVARIAFAVVVVVVGITLVLPRSFTSTGVFVPAGGDALASRASGLAAQLGVALPTGAGGQTPDFYAELLQSQSVLGTLPFDTVTFTKAAWWPWTAVDTIHGSVAEILGVEDDAVMSRRDRAIRSLRELIEVKVLPLSGTVTLRVTTDYAGLSQFIASRMIELVNEYNRTQRQTQARAEREFTEARVVQARADLVVAEDSLRDFLVRNRTFESSPSLRFEAERLEREVSMRQQVFGTLNDAYEVARISEVRTTPVISVVQTPERAGLPDRRYLIQKALIALILGVGLGGVVAVVRQTVRGGMISRVGDSGALLAVWKEAVIDLRRPWRLLARHRAA